MKTPFASIIVPVYNGGKTIRQCLEALSQQKFNNSFEIIVVDDGSTDNTKKLVKWFPQVKLIEENHAGPAAARNLGAKKAKGEILVFLDADCVAGDDLMLAKLCQPFKSEEIAGVQGGYKTRQKQLMARFVQTEIEQRYALMKKLEFIDFIGTYCCAYRKNVFLKEGGFDQSFPIASGEDPEFSFRLAKKGFKLVFRPEAFVFHWHPTSLLSYLKTKFFRAFYRVPLYKKHKKKMVKDSYTPQLLKARIGLIYALVPVLLVRLLLPLPLLDYGFLFLLSALILSLLPFTFFALKKSFLIGLLSPVILLLRDLVFGFGLLAGAIKGVLS